MKKNMPNPIPNHCIHQLFEIQVEKTPDAIAVIFEERQLTYRELNEKANQLAHYLQQLGVKPETLVGICVERSLEMIIALLGILKAGGAYVPLDPSYPQDRLNSIAEDALFPFLLTQQHLLDVLPQHQAQTIYVEKKWEIFLQQPKENLDTEVRDNNLSYVLYTSGSTGKPKGVAIEHRNTVALIEWAKEFFTLEQLQGVLASTSLCFDLSVFELFVTLSCGGKVILAQNALQLPQLSAASQVTLINTVPSAIATLYRINGIPESVNTINLAGEPLQNALVQQLYQLDFVKQVVNLYGPTEDTTYSTVAVIPKGWKDIPLIGRPIAKTQIYLVEYPAQRKNDILRTVSIGTVGEVYISGAGLARGYLNRAELTAEKFIPNPFSNQPDAKLYKTGDLAICLPDGNLKYLGRIDHQVKIRGFRIELGEIESILLQYPTVAQIIVVDREAPSGENQLVAYIVPQNVADISKKNLIIRDLRNFLKQKLPEFMIPSAFILLKELPLTPNGKIDRRALPIPSWIPMEQGLYVEPRNSIEAKLAEIWSKYLKINQIGIYDNFYEISGHSLLAIRLVSEINKIFKIDLPLNIFLENFTIEKLAKIIEVVRLEEKSVQTNISLEDDIKLDFNIYPQNIISEPIPAIFLTGATGFLGAFLLFELLNKTKSDIYCLVRATSIEEGRAKIKSNLKSYLIWQEKFQHRIIPVIGDLSKQNLGIELEIFLRLAEKIDIIYHCGAWVNMIYPYSALKAANVLGTQEVLRLASQTKIKPVHYISTLDVFSSNKNNNIRTVSEIDSIGPGSDLYSGYAQSKYVAEQLLQEARLRGLPIYIYRPSNIMGQSQTGACPDNSFVSLMIKGCLQMGIAPKINAFLNLIPVDYASQVIVNLSLQSNHTSHTFHVVNPEPIEWGELINLLSRLEYLIQQASYETWYSQLFKLSIDGSDNVLAPLATILTNQKFVQKLLGSFYFDCQNTLNNLSINNIVCPSIDDKMLRIHLSHFDRVGRVGRVNLIS
jgi:amino acid adenylation domain-containing protein/thioester reductase-like protein